MVASGVGTSDVPQARELKSGLLFSSFTFALALRGGWMARYSFKEYGVYVRQGGRRLSYVTYERYDVRKRGQGLNH